MSESKDEELLLRLKNFEDNFVERKTSADSKDWLKTVVAFANSTPVDQPAVLFIGVKDDGTPEDKPVNLDSLQQSFGKEVSKAYPPIYCLTKILEANSRQFFAVVIPGSAERPHFAGRAFIRKGSETVEASDEQFVNLIASRNSKVYEILNWKGKSITVHWMNVEGLRSFGSVARNQVCVVEDCNQFYVTLRDVHMLGSIPLHRVEVSFDNENERLKLEIRPV